MKKCYINKVIIIIIIIILGHLSVQGPYPPIAQFGQAASSKKSPGGSKLLPF
uniref:Uncharacterized protein n=1 Tax=Anguilla anguilla TaxID=7936 RepID=A0A0E9TZX1_ANGAN